MNTHIGDLSVANCQMGPNVGFEWLVRLPRCGTSSSYMYVFRENPTRRIQVRNVRERFGLHRENLKRDWRWSEAHLKITAFSPIAIRHGQVSFAWTREAEHVA